MPAKTLNRFLLCCFLCALALPAFADAPIPARKAKDKQSLQVRLQQEKNNKNEIQKSLKQLEKDLESTRKDLVKKGSLIQEQEKLLFSLEQRIEKLTIEEADLSTKLKEDYGKISELIIASSRLSRIPTETLMLRPEKPLETARAALLLENILPAIYQRSAQLSADLSKLNEIKTSLGNDKSAALKTKALLDNDYKQIEKLANDRERLFKSLNKDYQETVNAIKKIQRDAKSAKELIARINKLQTKQREKPSPKTAAVKIPNLGNARLPTTGAIKINFGQVDVIGAKSQGLTIIGQPQSLVVAPLGGVIKFSGQFKNFKQLIILEHKDGYHSLIAGLDSINVLAGQSVKSGEPLGKLPIRSSRGEQPTLYYELRQNGEPVNPLKKLNKLRI